MCVSLHCPGPPHQPSASLLPVRSREEGSDPSAVWLRLWHRKPVSFRVQPRIWTVRVQNRAQSLLQRGRRVTRHMIFLCTIWHCWSFQLKKLATTFDNFLMRDHRNILYASSLPILPFNQIREEIKRGRMRTTFSRGSVL